MIAGGQSLIPLMKLRFASPVALVDINRIEGLDTIEEKDGFLAHRRARAPQGLRALGAPARGATACSATRRRRSPTRSCATAARSPARSPTPIPRATGARCCSRPEPRSRCAAPAGRARSRSTSCSSGRSRRASSRPRSSIAVQVPDPGPTRRRHVPEARAQGRRLRHGRRRRPSELDNGNVGRAGIALTGVGPSNLRATAAEESLAGASSERRHDQGGGRAGRRGRAAARRQSRQRRVQAERRPGLRGARAPQGRRDGALVRRRR